MIKKLLTVFLKYKCWLIILMLWNLLFGMFLWLIDSNRFFSVFFVMLLGCFLLYGLMGFWLYRIEEYKKRDCLDYIENLDVGREDQVLSFLSEEEKEVFHLFGKIIREKEKEVKKRNKDRNDYEEYIEKWAHEIKTL